MLCLSTLFDPEHLEEIVSEGSECNRLDGILLPQTRRLRLRVKGYLYSSISTLREGYTLAKECLAWPSNKAMQRPDCMGRLADRSATKAWGVATHHILHASGPRLSSLGFRV